MAKRFKPVAPLLPGFEPEAGDRPAEGPSVPPSGQTPQASPPATTAADERAGAIAAMLAQSDRPPGPPPQSLAGQTVWAVDCHSLIHQVFHALPEMTSPRGEPVAAVYGFARDLLYLLESKRPDFLFCAFDLPGKTFRHAMYPQYKEHRPAMPEDLAPQIISCHRVVRALGIPALGMPSFEADDILATLARLVEQLDGRCYVVTSDKDCRQLISERVKLYNIRKNEVLDREALRTDWGISPHQVVDYLALVGDASDNVPGVPLVGPVYARQLLEKYGSLEGVLKHTDELTAVARRENLKKYGQQAILSRQLVQLDDHVPVAIDWQAARWDASDLAPVLELFEEFGFRSLAEKVRGRAGEGAAKRAEAPMGTVPFSLRENGDSPQSDAVAMPKDKQPSPPAPLPEGEGRDTLPAPPRPASAHPPEGEGRRKAEHRLVDTAEKFAAFLAELRRSPAFPSIRRRPACGRGGPRSWGCPSPGTSAGVGTCPSAPRRVRTIWTCPPRWKPCGRCWKTRQSARSART